MQPPPLPADESQRLATLRHLELLDTPREERFDRITRLAAALLEVPIAVISLVDADRQWFKAAYGLDATETPRDISFCGHAILNGDLLVVPDALKDARFADNPLVTGDPRIRFYAGHPLKAAEGSRVGTLCVIDRQPREFSAAQEALLADLANIAEAELNSIAREVREKETLLALAEMVPEHAGAKATIFAKLTELSAKTTEVARASVWLFSADRSALELHDLYQAASGRHSTGMALPRTPFPAYFAALEEGISLAAEDATTDPRTCEFTESYLRPLGIRAMLDAPVRWRGQVVGVVCLEHTGSVRRWRGNDESFAAALADRVALTLEGEARCKAEEELRLANALLEERVAARTADLSQALAQQAAILESSLDGILVMDHEGHIVSFNPAAERIFGYQSAEVIGRSLAEVIIPQRLRQAHREGFQRHLTTGEKRVQGRRLELPGCRADGTEILLEVAILRMPGAEPPLFTGFLRDITASKADEAATLAAKEAAEQANASKTQFLANMSHEVRTPLNGILGIATMMLETELTSAQRQLAQLMERNGETMLTIVNDILDFSKIEAGHLELDFTDFSLSEMVAEIVHLHARRASAKGLGVSSVIADGVPAWVHGDPLRIKRVLTNLVGNAVKFTSRGSVALTVEPEPGRPGFLHFAVSDRGIGIAKEAQARVFEAFVQADNTTTRNFGGTGLGLAISKQLVTAMGGEIGVESKLRQGSTFWFTLPLAEVAAPVPVLTPAEAPAPERHFAGMRVLLAEDSELNRMVALDRLGKLGCTTEAVVNGELAVEACTAREYDVVLMDCHMPVMDGYEATRCIREREAAEGQGQHVHIIAITANVMPEERVHCLEIGMDGYLSKPFTLAGLRVVLEAAAASAEARSAVPPPVEVLAPPCEGETRSGARYARLVALFKTEADIGLAALEAAHIASDAEELRRAAHKLRGAAGTMRAARLHPLCGEVEAHARAGRLVEAGALLPTVQAECIRAVAALEAECALSSAEDAD